MEKMKKSTKISIWNKEPQSTARRGIDRVFRKMKTILPSARSAKENILRKIPL